MVIFKGKTVNFPLRISYPANRPYAGATTEKQGERVVITYASVNELRDCLALHALAQQLEKEVKPTRQGVIL